MRTLMKVIVPAEAGNKAIQSGALPKVIQATVERVRPEAVYFSTEGGDRIAYFVFDMKDPSDMPAIGEPLFQALHAKLQFAPVMTPQDLQAGLAKVQI
jgi:hypothetical protein